MTELAQKFESLVDQMDRRSGGWVKTLRLLVLRFIEMRGAEAAASLAYYALFSLFPLTLFLVALLGFLIKSEAAYIQVIAFTRMLFPFSSDLVEQNLQEVLSQRGAIGLVSFLGMFWAASGFFNTLARNVNLAWPKVKLRGFVHNRLVALAMVFALFLLLLASLISTTLISLLPALVQLLGGSSSLAKTPGWLILLQLVPAVFTFLMFVALYRWVPNKIVQWKAVLIGALVVTLIWEAAKWLFTLYLGSGLVQYQYVYGSLGKLIALMVWIYFGNLISLFGAYLVAALDLAAEQKNRVHQLETPIEIETTKGIRG